MTSPAALRDRDLASLAPTLSAVGWAELRGAIEESPIPFRVEMVDADSHLPEALREAIRREGIVVYTREGE